MVQTMLCKHSYNQKIHQQHAGVEGFGKNVQLHPEKRTEFYFIVWLITLWFLSSLSWPQLWSWFFSSFSYSLPRFSPPLCALPACDSSWVQGHLPSWSAPHLALISSSLPAKELQSPSSHCQIVSPTTVVVFQDAHYTEWVISFSQP